MTNYFGEPWDAPVIDDGLQVSTPVGEPCIRCEVPIKDGDQGFEIPWARPEGGWAYYHRACLLGELGISPSLLNHEGGT